VTNAFLNDLLPLIWYPPFTPVGIHLVWDDRQEKPGHRCEAAVWTVTRSSRRPTKTKEIDPKTGKRPTDTTRRELSRDHPTALSPSTILRLTSHLETPPRRVSLTPVRTTSTGELVEFTDRAGTRSSTTTRIDARCEELGTTRHAVNTIHTRYTSPITVQPSR